MKLCEICAKEKRSDFETQLFHFIYSLLSACYVSGSVLATGSTKMNKTVFSEGPHGLMKI